jgi:hypothetical protein
MIVVRPVPDFARTIDKAPDYRYLSGHERSLGFSDHIEVCVGELIYCARIPKLCVGQLLSPANCRSVLGPQISVDINAGL